MNLDADPHQNLCYVMHLLVQPWGTWDNCTQISSQLLFGHQHNNISILFWPSSHLLPHHSDIMNELSYEQLLKMDKWKGTKSQQHSYCSTVFDIITFSGKYLMTSWDTYPEFLEKLGVPLLLRLVDFVSWCYNIMEFVFVGPHLGKLNFCRLTHKKSK